MESHNLKGADLRGQESKPDSRQYLLMTEYANQGYQAGEATPVIQITGTAPMAKPDNSRRFFAGGEHPMPNIS